MDDQRRQRPFARRSDADALDMRKVDVIENELRALPELEAPGGLWEHVRERLDAEADHPTPRARYRQAPLALAASLAIVAVAAVFVSFHLSTGDNESAGGEVASANVLTREAPEYADIIETLMEQSRQAEERRRAALAFYWPSAPERVLREQIGGIDAALNEQMFTGTVEPKSREALLRDRVTLMADLTDIERYRQHEFVRQVSF